MTETQSPLIDTNPKVLEPIPTNGGNESKSYTYMLVIVIILLLMFLFYHAYSCFHTNQNINFLEPYKNGSPRDDPQSDDSFDVEKEVKKLIQMQERFLEKLQRARRGN